MTNVSRQALDGHISLSSLLLKERRFIPGMNTRGFSARLSVTYVVQLTSKGARMIDAWFSGNREEIKQALNDLAKRQ